MNLDAAMEVVGGDEQLLRDAVAVFVGQDFPEQIKKMRQSLAQQDGQGLRAAAHTVKGAARSFGGVAFGDTAQRLEDMGRNGQLADAAETVEELETESKRFADFFSKLGLIPTGHSTQKEADPH